MSSAGLTAHSYETSKLEDGSEDRQAERRRLHERWRGPHTRLLPFLIKPGLNTDIETNEQTWLAPNQRAVPWLDLLYDLVIVAILTVFSTAHEVSSAHSVLVYLSYFVILWWIWASQVSYDVRFQANDWIHRLFKFLQLGAFAFVGVTAQNFDPSNVVFPADVNAVNAAQQDEGARAFSGVAIAYASGRVLLVLQYLYVTWHTRKHKEHLASLLIPAIVTLISAALWYVSGALAESAVAKLSMAYIGLGLEYITALALPFLPGYIKMPAATVSERYGALTLIILGEGIIGVIRSFSAVVAGFGFSHSAYAQCFCALVIISASWHFLFHGFNTETHMGRKRGSLWLILHLPLHLVILLLLAGLRNAATYGNIGDAVMFVAPNIDILIDGFAYNNFSASEIPMNYLTIQFAKLQLQPSWPEEVADLQAEVVGAQNGNGTVDPLVDLVQYTTEILVGISSFYQVTPSDEVLEIIDKIYNLNSTYTTNEDQRNETLDEAQDLLDEFLTAYQTDIGHGVLFFLPCAGGLVFLASILTLLRTPPFGAWMWTSWGIQTAVATALCFLGFLDLGNQTLDVAATSEIAVYQLLDANWMLPTAAMAYAGLIISDGILMVLARRAGNRTLQTPASSYSSILTVIRSLGTD